MTTDAVGGVWTYAVELARGLSAAKVEVMLVVIGPEPNAAQRTEAIGIPGLVLIVPGLELEWQDRGGPLGADAGERLRGLAEAFDADIVHCNGFREAGAGYAAPVVVAAHSCVRTWWWACRHEDPGPGWSAYAEGVRTGLRAAATVVAPTEAFLADFAAAWSRLTRPRVIHNGIDFAVPAATERRGLILAAGRLWDEAKNVALLRGVAADLSWPVCLAGEPPVADLSGPVRWLGRLDRSELVGVMAQAAIFVAPARYEPFGLAILEAAKSGCALVLGNLPSLVELWGDAARFVPPNDAQALRRTLLDLAEDQEALQRLQAAARLRAGDFSRSAMVRAYLSVYGELMRPASPRAHAA
jgi:glycosyltransferase involved in cell wall biosynthesis